MIVLMTVMNPLAGCLLNLDSAIPGLVKIEQVPAPEQMISLSQHPGVKYVTSRRPGVQGWYAPLSLVHLGTRTGDLSKIRAPLPGSVTTTPSGLELQDHQLRSVAFLRGITPELEGRLLAANMGLGKSICALQALWEDGYLQRPGLVCGPSLGRSTWCGLYSDATKHYGFGITPLSGVTNTDRSVLEGGGWFYIHYDILNAWHAWISAVLRPAAIVFDEVHLLCNYKSQRHRDAVSMSLAASVERRIGLTGTPIPNERAELWGVMRTLQPRQWDSRPEKFWSRFCGGQREDDRAGGHWVMTQDTNTLELRARLAGDYLRYTQADAKINLPPATRHRIAIEDTTSVAMEEYWLAERSIKEYIKQYGVSTPVDGALSLGGGASVGIPKSLQAKPGYWRIVAMNTLMGLLSDIKRQAAPRAVFDALNQHDMLVVFTQRVASAKRLVADIQAQDTTGSIAIFGPVSGETSHDTRLEIASKFAEMKGTGQRAVFVATIGSAGISFNQLVAAESALFVDLWWRPCDLLQAEGRILRIGQTASSVNFYYLVVPNTLDDHILALLDEKARSASEVSPNDTESLCLSADLSPQSTTNGEPDLDAICSMLAPLLETA